MGNIESFCLFLFFFKSSERLEILISWLHLSSRNYFQFQKYPWLRAQVYLCYDYWSCVILINWLVRSFHVKLLGKASRGRSTHLSKCRLCRPFGGWNQDWTLLIFFRFSVAPPKNEHWAWDSSVSACFCSTHDRKELWYFQYQYFFLFSELSWLRHLGVATTVCTEILQPTSLIWSFLL